MMDLGERREALLGRIVAAGVQGHVIEQGEVADAITLGLFELVTITTTHPQRAVATARGRAFRTRTAA